MKILHKHRDRQDGSNQSNEICNEKNGTLKTTTTMKQIAHVPDIDMDVGKPRRKVEQVALMRGSGTREEYTSRVTEMVLDVDELRWV
jgi:hypothetical protein